jgi:four helix bundle protein
MEQPTITKSGKPYDLHERTLLFAVDIVSAVQFLQRRGPIARRISYQLLDSGTSIGANYEEADGASSHNDFLAKSRISLKEAKETRFRLRVCRKSNLLDQQFDALVRESDELVRIFGKLVATAEARKAREATKSPR